MSRDPRDWQADMDMCEKATRGPWRWKDGTDHDERQIETEWIHPQLKGTAPIIALAITRSTKYIYIKEEDAIFIANVRTALPYWLQQSKQLASEVDFWKGEANQAKNDKAHWVLKHTAAEQKYQTQGNEIAEMRDRADKAEERGSKLKESLEWVRNRTKFSLPNSRENDVYKEVCRDLATLYPLDKEDTPNG